MVSSSESRLEVEMLNFSTLAYISQNKQQSFLSPLKEGEKKGKVVPVLN
jgi:hypothetical protein